ncbi:unnamed protein product [Urochloa humidicola]
MKWEEIKQMIHSRDQMEKMDMQFQEQHRMSVNDDIPLCDKPAKQPARSIRQRKHGLGGKFRAYSGKVKLVKEVRDPPSFTLRDKKVAEDAEYDPYGDIYHHQDFEKALKEVRPGHVLCTSCFFEKKKRRTFSYIVHHMADEHGSTGILCVICGLRFLTEKALSFHKDFFHNKQKDLVAPG